MESEDDILNRIITEETDVYLDSHSEDCILNDDKENEDVEFSNEMREKNTENFKKARAKERIVEEKSNEEVTVENDSVVIRDSLKRSQLANHTNVPNAKKPKLINQLSQEKPPQNDVLQTQNGEASSSGTQEIPKLKTLASFANFMQSRKIPKKLTRSDLEEIVLQKICESLVLTSPQGELNETIRKQNKENAILREEVRYLKERAVYMDIIVKTLNEDYNNRKLTGSMKPVVPMKMARSVAIQVNMRPINEAPKQQGTTQTAPEVEPSAAVRKVLNSPSKPQPENYQQLVAKNVISPFKKPAEPVERSAVAFNKPVAPSYNSFISPPKVQPEKKASQINSEKTISPFEKPAEPVERPAVAFNKPVAPSFISPPKLQSEKKASQINSEKTISPLKKPAEPVERPAVAFNKPVAPSFISSPKLEPEKKASQISSEKTISPFKMPAEPVEKPAVAFNKSVAPGCISLPKLQPEKKVSRINSKQGVAEETISAIENPAEPVSLLEKKVSQINILQVVTKKTKINPFKKPAELAKKPAVAFNKPIAPCLTSPPKLQLEIKVNQINSGQVVAETTITSSVKKPAEPVEKPAVVFNQPAAPIFIDLTDDDDDRRLAQVSTANGVQFRLIPDNKVALNSDEAGPKNKSSLNQVLSPNSLDQGSLFRSPQMPYVIPTITGGQQNVAVFNLQPTVSLMSDVNKPGEYLTTSNVSNTKTVNTPKNPAPLQDSLNPNLKLTLPKPILTLKKLDNNIVLQWQMPYNLDLYETISSYQIYAYQVTNSLPRSDNWKKVGDVKALSLPMSCTLSHILNNRNYYFALRAVDVRQRSGAFSDPQGISL